MRRSGRRGFVLGGIAAAAFAVALVGLAPSPALASGDITVTDADGKVLEAFAVSNGDEIDYQLAQALALGKSAEDYQQTTVSVPAGAYTIGTQRWVRIFSNTNLVLDPGTTLTANVKNNGNDYTDNFLMLQANHYSSGTLRCGDEGCAHGGYTQFSNIHVSGGTWDAGCSKHSDWNVSGMVFQHGQDISFDSITFKHFTNHALNIAGTSNVQVTNCTYQDSVKFTGDSERFWGTEKRSEQETIDRIRSTESVHTDFCNEEGETTAYPLDSTPCQNITVSNCTFTKTYGGVGTHHDCTDSKMDNIDVSNCQFDLKDGNGVNLFSCTSAKVENCSITGGYSLVRGDDATVSVTGNTATGNTGNAIAGVNASNMTVTNNTVSGAAVAGVLFSDATKGTVSGNSITCPKEATGINISGAQADITGNTVDGGISGIALKSTTGACTVSGNTVKGNKGNGIYVYSAKKGKVTVSDNLVPSAKNAGVRVDKSKNVTVTRNTVTNAKFDFSINATSELTVSGNKASGGNTVVLITGKSKDLTVTGNTITCAKKGMGVNLTNSQGSITNNTITNGVNGIELKSTTGACTVSGNTVKGNKGNGIYVYSAKKGKVTVSGNLVPSAKNAGVRVDKSKNVTVTGNTVTNAKFCISVASSSKLKINKNTASGGDTVIRVINKSKKVTVTGNTLKKTGKLCKSNAIYFYNGCTGTISNNKIVKPGTAGIRIDKKCKVKVKGNSITSPGTKKVSIAA